MLIRRNGEQLVAIGCDCLECGNIPGIWWIRDNFARGSEIVI